MSRCRLSSISQIKSNLVIRFFLRPSSSSSVLHTQPLSYPTSQCIHRSQNSKPGFYPCGLRRIHILQKNAPVRFPMHWLFHPTMASRVHAMSSLTSSVQNRFRRTNAGRTSCRRTPRPCLGFAGPGTWIDLLDSQFSFDQDTHGPTGPKHWPPFSLHGLLMPFLSFLAFPRKSPGEAFPTCPFGSIFPHPKPCMGPKTQLTHPWCPSYSPLASHDRLSARSRAARGCQATRAALAAVKGSAI